MIYVSYSNQGVEVIIQHLTAKIELKLQRIRDHQASIDDVLDSLLGLSIAKQHILARISHVYHSVLFEPYISCLALCMSFRARRIAKQTLALSV